MSKKEAKHPSKPDMDKNGPEEVIRQKEKECSELQDKYLRLQAEFDNYKKRSFREKTEFVKFANEGLILELLGILDNFERGIKAADLNKDFKLLHQGVDMISRQLHELLKTKGLKRIEAVGQKFDPHYHEAMEVVESDGVTQDTVVEELQPGYLLNDRIVRTAKVKVAKPKTTDQDSKKVEEKVKEEQILDQENNQEEKKEENEIE